MTLQIVRAAFSALAMALMALTLSAVARKRALATRRDWYRSDKWECVADVSGVSGRVLLYGAGVLLGLAAVG